MRILILALAFSFVAVSADARPKKHARHASAKPPAPAHVVPNARSAEEHARAEAELADLRAGRVTTSEEAQPAEPVQQWAIQENDHEVPAPLKRGGKAK
jgi:hypothetical protein